MGPDYTKLGPNVRLDGISVTQLPARETPNIEPELEDFILPYPEHFVKAIINEALPFIDSVYPKRAPTEGWRRHGSPRKYTKVCTAPVDVFIHQIPGKVIGNIPGMSPLRPDGKAETWVTRRSLHKDDKTPGTACWEEFVDAFKDNHAQTEIAFTPTVLEARNAMVWEIDGLTFDVDGETWGHGTMKVLEMVHLIKPKPLKNRVFPVLQLVIERLGNFREFCVISIPIRDMESASSAHFAKDKSLIIGHYVSVERIRVLPNTHHIEWVMTTASNASGVLPQWIQNMAVPGLIAHDVEWYMDFANKKRQGLGSAPAAAKYSNDVLNKELPRPPPISKIVTSDKVPAGASEPKIVHPVPASLSVSLNKELPPLPTNEDSEN
jgi:hypothetical protein